MKRISARTFFSVLWKGVCQALRWFFGLFGYKRDSKFAKCVWGVFAISAAIIVAIIAISMICDVTSEMWNKYKRENHTCDRLSCWAREHICRDIYIHNHEDGKGYIYNIRTGEKLIKNVTWIAEPVGKDSLVCFSNGKKRGYFNKYTGKVVVEPKYDHAWIFSEGLACVDDGGFLRFIDETGKVVIDNMMLYDPDREGMVFHGGYCVVNSNDGDKYGLMDKTGKYVLPLEFDYVRPKEDYELWEVKKGKEEGVFDKEMKPLVPLMECSTYIDEGTIDVTMADHTMRKYDLQGTLLGDFYISSVRMLEYEKEDIVYLRNKSEDEEYYDSEGEEDFYHPKATARLRAYTAGDGYEGLMTADGHVVTRPLYSDIDAIDYDLYLCETTNYDKVIVNGKGEVVK